MELLESLVDMEEIVSCGKTSYDVDGYISMEKWHGRPFTRANINDLKFIQIALSYFDKGRLSKKKK